MGATDPEFKKVVNQMCANRYMKLPTKKVFVGPEVKFMFSDTRLAWDNKHLRCVPEVDWDTHFPNLELLDLENNSIPSPPSLINNRKLTWLSMSNNKLTKPPTLCGGHYGYLCHGLNFLSLRKNKLTYPPNIMKTNLESLFLDDNELEEPPSFSPNHIYLRNLHLQNNKLTRVELPTNAAAVERLLQLCVDNNKLTAFPPVGVAHKKLWKLTLQNNRISQPLPQPSSLPGSLYELRLDDNKFTGAFWSNANLQPWVAANTLKHLTLADNQVDGTVSSNIFQLPLKEFAVEGNPVHEWWTLNAQAMLANSNILLMSSVFFNGNLPTWMIQTPPARATFDGANVDFQFKAAGGGALMLRRMKNRESAVMALGPYNQERNEFLAAVEMDHLKNLRLMVEGPMSGYNMANPQSDNVVPAFVSRFVKQ